MRTWFQPLASTLGVLAVAELVTIVATRRFTLARPAEFLRAE